MEQFCREEINQDRIISAYVLSSIFYDLSTVVELYPCDETIAELETKYKSTIILLLEKVISETALEEQFNILTKLINLNWDISSP